MSYGSNMSGYALPPTSPAAARQVAAGPTGRTERSPPRRTGPVHLPDASGRGRVEVWRGGTAFYDHDADGRTTAARAYLDDGRTSSPTSPRRRCTAPPRPTTRSWRPRSRGIVDDRHVAGPGRYETLVEVGRLEGVPMLLFTAPHGIDHVEHTQPSPEYLALLGDGLRASRQWDDEDLEAYFGRVLLP